MELKSEIMEELWKIKEELSSGYKSVDSVTFNILLSSPQIW